MYAGWVSHVDSIARSGSDEPEPTVGKPPETTDKHGIIYEDGKTVPTDLLADWQIYRIKFGKPPYDEAVLVRARDAALAKDDWK